MDSVAPSSDVAVQTLHVREVAANLLLSRSLQMSDAAGGMVVFQDAGGRWNKDSFALPGRPNRIQELAPLLEALLEWTLYSEKPVAIANLGISRWSQHLLHGTTPPEGAVAATPLAQRGSIWGAVAVYWSAPVQDAIRLLGELAELATEPLSSLGPGRPEGVA
ncbi:MAG TPA: GAF domain-containing protein [Candidatus Dormibacteraeota bacterium]|nr:GAF domain-containing protein [Candidatus Dormibacteraeota bacterium]